MIYEQHYVWSILLRLYHWCFVISIVTLAVTGFYINSPWTQTTLEGSGLYPMLTMRNIHGLAGYLFTAAILARLYLLLFGNRQERVLDLLPVTPNNIGNFLHTLSFYSYCTEKHSPRLGHNTLAGVFYLVTFILALLQLVAGFYLLYPESGAWQGWGLALLGPYQQARFIHYLIMWYFILFAVIHLYIVVWNDIKTKEGLISSIFNGTKYTPSS